MKYSKNKFPRPGIKSYSKRSYKLMLVFCASLAALWFHFFFAIDVESGPPQPQWCGTRTTYFTCNTKNQAEIPCEVLREYGYVSQPKITEYTWLVFNRNGTYLYPWHEDPDYKCRQTMNSAGAFSKIIAPKEQLALLVNDYDFFPATFRLQEKAQREAFFKQLPCRNDNPTENIWILKEYVGTGGKGMKISSDFLEIRKLLLDEPDEKCAEEYGSEWDTTKVEELSKQNYMAQRYVHNPMLMDGKKFHFRTQLVVACDRPLLIYYSHSYIMTSSYTFDVNSKTYQSHITNRHQQKVKGPGDGLVSEREFQEYLTKHNIAGPNWVEEVMTPRMIEIFRTVFTEAKEQIHELSRKVSPNIHGFRLLGADLVITEDLELQLLEINRRPSIIEITKECYWIADICESFYTMFRELFLLVEETYVRLERGENFENLKSPSQLKLILDGSI